jgi:hypothetical protein
MAIKRYIATADNSITNAFKDNLSTRGTGSNAGAADILETFSIYGQESTGSSELSRILINFPISNITTDRANGTVPASGSVSFFLNLYNAAHSSTLPRDYKLTVNAINGSWEEGYGLDLDNYTDLTYDKIGSNWINANGSFVGASFTMALQGGANKAAMSGQTFTLTDSNGVSQTFTFNIANDTVTNGSIGMNSDSNTTDIINTIKLAINDPSLSDLDIEATTITAIGDADSEMRLLIKQKTTGLAGNTTVDLSGVTHLSVLNSTTGFTGGSGTWATPGGDIYTDSSSSFEQTFEIGDEDLSINITPLVEQWINSEGNILGTKNNYGVMVKLSASYEATSSTNLEGAVISYYTKKFFARDSEFFFKRPCLEARWDSSLKDQRGSFYYSSSLAPSEDNLNTIYLYNYVRGRLRDIPSIGTDNIYVSIFSGSADNTSPSGSALELYQDTVHVSDLNKYTTTGSHVSTGIYKCSFAFTGSSTLETVYDVWFSGSRTAHPLHAGLTSVQFHTGTISPDTFAASNINPNGKYVVSMPNLKQSYSNKETERFRLYVRNKNWSPNIYTKAQATPQTLIIESASFQVTRVVDQQVVIPYGTGSNDNDYSMLSYDVSGNYFDLDLSMLEAGYTYGFQYSFYEDSVSSYREQPYLFKFRVEKDEY